MLSYRHAFHAGNFADVLKHITQILCLEHFLKKDKAFTYLDTHSGAGMYELSASESQKTGEYLQGIAKLWELQQAPDAVEKYLEVVRHFNSNIDLDFYPGSPAIAHQFLRAQDNSHCFELHPTDANLLKQNLRHIRRSKVHTSDGYTGVKALLPPPSRRGLVFIDPPYELKTDYVKAIQAIEQGYKRFSTGTYCLWYPVVQRPYVHQIIDTLNSTAIKNVLQVEWCLQADSDAFGMTGTGMLIVNPPWTLKRELEVVMPFLEQHLGSTMSHYKIQQLIAE
ncbi:23S rRNA (adenine(2030)-N(6))-methyltransferase RlmJ [Echinimonas agarilytica]|uniref:Ribosomal RNA large subunit methyltransferase J n=1 Tax=Echinimonas agarilytica TaxID=1215918 RepID=A0AA42B828_9GAMM|nr:23S rRNA (adenine(2030)-N(6))-methyltransferase RlmJ [Echinimonas agarilytica]MCM2680409.1 23S rRNA (adenine(2030)-N(6))-methyltransferase RlmJ [Echinimonas agarilytica]